MNKPRRKQPSLRVKLASALLTIVRPDDRGKLVPVIGHQEAKTLTPDQIISRFEFDHAVHDAWGGSLHPSNLTPRPIPEHREKTKRDRKDIDKVRRGLKRRGLGRGGEAAEVVRCVFRERMELGARPKARMQYTAYKATHKRKVNGRVVRRVKR